MCCLGVHQSIKLDEQAGFARPTYIAFYIVLLAQCIY
jgi:hypothetical protein